MLEYLLSHPWKESVLIGIVTSLIGSAIWYSVIKIAAKHSERAKKVLKKFWPYLIVCAISCLSTYAITYCCSDKNPPTNGNSSLIEAGDQANKFIESLESKIESNQKEIQELNDSPKENRTHVDELEREIKTLQSVENQVKTLKAAYENGEINLDELNSSIEKLKKENAL